MNYKNNNNLAKYSKLMIDIGSSCKEPDDEAKE